MPTGFEEAAARIEGISSEQPCADRGDVSCNRITHRDRIGLRDSQLPQCQPVQLAIHRARKRRNRHEDPWPHDLG